MRHIYSNLGTISKDSLKTVLNCASGVGKVAIVILFFLSYRNVANGQCTSTVYYDNMETFTWFGDWYLYNYSNFYTNISVSPAASAVHYGIGGSAYEQDWYVLPNITGLNPAYTYKVKFRLASTLLTNPTASTRGVDSGDFIEVQLSTNGGVSYSSEIRIKGYNNAQWNYSATGVAAKTANGTLTQFTTPNGNAQALRPGGYSTVELTLPVGSTQCAVDIYTRANNAGEDFWIDNVELIEIIPQPTLSIAGNTPICSGGSLTLTASGAQTYSWNNGISNGVPFNPTSSSTYTVIGTNTGMVNGTGSTNSCTATANVSVTVQSPPTAPTSISGTNTICSGQSTTLTAAGGSNGSGATFQWGTGTVGSNVIAGQTASTLTVSPTVTTTYWVRRVGNTTCTGSTGGTSATVTVTPSSTAPAITLMPGTYCPNTDITLSAAGGTSGAGAVINWYSGANGTGTFLGTGGSVVVAPTATTTYYVRREGLCNNSADDAITINAKNFVYAANGASASNYCTDNNGWNHFYNGDNIIFSVEGDLSGAAPGFPIATINNNNAFYQETEGPGTAPGCVNNENPNEERFEMSRSWNLDFGGGTQNGTYKIRFYYPPAEKTAIENAANAWMANYVFCSYDYKYPSEPFYWFKNTASNYTAPDYDGDHYSATVSSTASGINYSEWNNISSFSGGSGAIILLPSITPLPVELVNFSSSCMDSDVAIKWSTASENNSMHFEVESSVDAFNWKVIAVVDAAQFSTSLIDYAILHEGAAREKNYYRLKQVDTDGAYEYYSIIYSDCGSDLDGAPIIFPNPSKNNFTIDFGGSGMKGIVQLTLVSMEGKEISNRQLNLGEGVSTFQINNLELQPGLYLIKMTDVTGKLFIIKHRFN